MKFIESNIIEYKLTDRITGIHSSIEERGSDISDYDLKQLLKTHYAKFSLQGRDFFLKTCGITHDMTYVSPDTNDPTKKFDINKHIDLLSVSNN